VGREGSDDRRPVNAQRDFGISPPKYAGAAVPRRPPKQASPTRSGSPEQIKEYQ